jgi:AcrR family transcriptional regulator
MSTRTSSPAPPTLTRQSIVDAALRMMDDEGYATFRLPRLSESLGIRTPSPYHHFRDKWELLSEVARAVVRETPLPDTDPSVHWSEYFVELAHNFRRTILRHGNTAPVLLQLLPREVMTPLYEAAAVRLAETSDLPVELHVVVLDGLENLTLGSALIEASHGLDLSGGAFPDVDPAGQAALIGQAGTGFAALATETPWITPATTPGADLHRGPTRTPRSAPTQEPVQRDPDASAGRTSGGTPAGRRSARPAGAASPDGYPDHIDTCPSAVDGAAALSRVHPHAQMHRPSAVQNRILLATRALVHR